MASENLYFGWGWGAASMWRSTDGGVNFSPLKGGPFQIGKLKISNDATGGVLYLVDNGADLGFGKSGSTGHTNAWRYVPEVPSGGFGIVSQLLDKSVRGQRQLLECGGSRSHDPRTLRICHRLG